MSQTRTQLTSKIATQNILSFSLVQTQMQANFKTIVEALQLYDRDISIILNFKDATQNQLKELNGQLGQSNKREERMENELANIRKLLTDAEHSSKKGLSESDKKEMMKQLAQLKGQMERKHEESVKNEQQMGKELKNMKEELERLNKGISSQNRNKAENSSKESIQFKNGFEIQLKNLLAEANRQQLKIQALQERIRNNENSDASNKLESFIHDQFHPTKKDILARLQKLEVELNEANRTIQSEKSLRNKLSEEVWKLNDIQYQKQNEKMSSQMNADRLKKIQNDILELKRRMQELKEEKGHKNTTETFIESPSKGKTIELSTDDSFKKEIMEKLNDQKQFFLRTYKKLESTNQGQNDKQKILKLEEGIMKLDYLLNDKADLDSVKKLLTYLQNKITYIFNIVIASNNQEDACIARKNWVCLSCEKKLDKYQGRIGSHLATGQLKTKPLDQEFVGGGMTLRPSKSKVDLPNLHKMSKKLKQ